MKKSFKGGIATIVVSIIMVGLVIALIMVGPLELAKEGKKTTDEGVRAMQELQGQM